MDTVEQLLTDIHEKLDELQPAIPWSFGRRARNEMRLHPHISWVEVGGDFGVPQKIGGIGGNIGTLVPRLELLIWEADREHCRTVLLNLHVAARAKLYGPNLSWLDFAFVNEVTGEYAQKGWQLLAHVDVRLPIPAETSPYAEVASTEHTTTIALLWGAFNWGDGHLYGGEPVC